MQSKIILVLNKASMIEIVQEWMDKHTKLGVKVEGVPGDNGTFKVSMEPDEDQKD